MRRRDAARLADRQRHGDLQSVQPVDHHRAGRGPGDPRRRRRDRLGCRSRDGARVRRGVVRQRHLARSRPGGDGARGCARRPRRPARARRRAHPAPPLRAGFDDGGGNARRSTSRAWRSDGRRADRRLGGGVVRQGSGGVRRGLRLRRPVRGSAHRRSRSTGSTRWRPTPHGCGRGFPTPGWSGPASACTMGASSPPRARRWEPTAPRWRACRRPIGSSSCTASSTASLQHELLLRVRAFFDVYDAATQLGILPARGTLGEKALLMLRGFGLRTARN